MSLRECPGCQRHVKSVETACPFCSVGLAPLAPAPVLPRARLGRAALLAIGGAATTIACQETRAVYGGPPVPDRTYDAGVTMPDAAVPKDDGQTMAPAYGAPPPTTPPPTATPSEPQRTIYGGPPVDRTPPRPK